MATDEQAIVFKLLIDEWWLTPREGNTLPFVCKKFSDFRVLDRLKMLKMYARANNIAGISLCVRGGPAIPEDTLKYLMLPDNLREPKKIKRETRELNDDNLRNVKKKLF